MNLSTIYPQLLAARGRLHGVAHRTPVVTSQTLDRAVGAKVFVKCENLQRMGAFKFRGAYNTISQLSPSDKSRGVIAYSSGNHAQAVALVSRLLGIQATIVMPENAPRIKREATIGYGADVITYDVEKTTREELAAEIAEEKGLVTIPPFDDERIIAGQGTAAAELHEYVDDLDVIMTPCGGGGLLSGTAVATRGMEKHCRVVGVEPELGDDATRSFRTRTLQTVRNPPTIADGTRTPSLGKLTFPLILELVDDMVTVSEEAIKEAVRFLFYRMKLVVEPSGALGIAALLSGSLTSVGKVGVIASGGNIDGDTMANILGPEGTTFPPDQIAHSNVPFPHGSPQDS